jgi:hypothetical protein
VDRKTAIGLQVFLQQIGLAMFVGLLRLNGGDERLSDGPRSIRAARKVTVRISHGKAYTADMVKGRLPMTALSFSPCGFLSTMVCGMARSPFAGDA